MGRKRSAVLMRSGGQVPHSASPLGRLAVRRAVAVAAWFGAVSVAQIFVGPELDHAARSIEHRIEEKLRAPANRERQPERSHEEEAIEPWELVGV
jgi:hypothetical protein